jgi:hypothetical protein
VGEGGSEGAYFKFFTAPPVKGEGILALLNLPPPLAGGVGGGG